MTDFASQDPAALARLGGLEVIARLLVEGERIGQHPSPFKGSSVEFVEHRQYYPGDEIRHIDWRAFGKTGKYYIKEFEEETNLRAYLFVDASGSMAYGASTLTKFEYARILAAALGYLLVGQSDAVGLVTFDSQVRDRIDPSASTKTLHAITASLEHRRPGAETGIGAVCSRLIPTLKPRSLVILLSDFFDEPRELLQVLQLFRRNRHDVILLQVIAPEEQDFPFHKPTQFRSLERQTQRMLVDPHRLRAVYLRQFREFQEQLRQLAGRCGFDLLTLSTAEPFARGLGAYLDWRARRSRASLGRR